VLLLAGYLAWVELAEPLALWWGGLPNDKKLSVLVDFIWMVCRCGDEPNQIFLENALALVSQLEDEPKDTNQENRRYYSFNVPLEHAFQRWVITKPSAQTWAKAVHKERDANLRVDLCYVARVIDQPESVEAFVRWCAEKVARVCW
jgi:hypothetical protein